ncbi:MAG: N-acetylmuramoyl-L-alanine amidase [Coleofasciculaceae cyanobacterium RL_1_1]|nr:N-acetylmuramoyl-L-alanine amidase [Coleofasciculaceae cyanobacterium RL_1_1]
MKFIASFVATLAGAYLPVSALSVVLAAPLETAPVRTSIASIQLDDATSTSALAALSSSDRMTQATGEDPKEIELQAQSSPVTVEYIELTTDGNRVLIRTDRRVDDYDTYWDRSSLAYAITIPNARFGPDVTLPDASSSSAIQWVNAEQDAYGNITIYVMPAPQVSVRGVNEPSTQMLAVELQPYGVNNSDGVGTAGNSGSSSFDWSSLNNLPEITDGRVVVVLDPGHGGPDPGAVGIGGLSEIDIVDPVANRVAELLRESGVEPILTRTGNYDLDLDPRVDLANRVQANLFVSIHANAISMSRPDVNGIETYYYQSGDRLADTIHESLIDATGSNDRGCERRDFTCCATPICLRYCSNWVL